MAETIRIKKYSNRRLYDTRQSRYINLEDIPAFLKEGNDVVVLDAGSGEDITAAVLLQLIVEREKRNIEGLPAELLKEFLVLQDTPARQFFDMAIKQGLAILREMKKAGLQAGRLPQASEMFSPSFWMERLFPGGAWPGVDLAPVGTDPEHEPDPEPEPEPEPESDSRDDIYKMLNDLRKRLDRMEKEQK